MHHTFDPKPRKSLKLGIVGALVLMVAVFLTVPYVAFIFRSPKGNGLEQINYVEAAPPPLPPPMPPRLNWMTEEEKTHEVLEFQAEFEPPSLEPLKGIDLTTSVPGAVGSISDDVFLVDAEEDWEAFDQDELDKKSKPISTPQPEFPEMMRKKGIVGEAWIHFIIDDSGDVKRAYVGKRTNDQFAAAALEAVQGWKFEPGERAGKPVNSRAVVPVQFNLEVLVEDF